MFVSLSTGIPGILKQQILEATQEVITNYSPSEELDDLFSTIEWCEGKSIPLKQLHYRYQLCCEMKGQESKGYREFIAMMREYATVGTLHGQLHLANYKYETQSPYPLSDLPYVLTERGTLKRGSIQFA